MEFLTDEFSWSIPTLSRLMKTYAQPGMVVFELGTYTGQSSLVMLPYIRQVKGRLYGVDWFKGNPGVEKLNEAFQRHDVLEVFRRNIREAGYEDDVTVLVGTADSVVPIVADGSIDFLFIDADHRYSSLRNDILRWYPKLKQGGVLCGHDLEKRLTEVDYQRCLEKCEEDTADGIHYGVIRAVGELFPHVQHENCIWWVERTTPELPGPGDAGRTAMPPGEKEPERTIGIPNGREPEIDPVNGRIIRGRREKLHILNLALEFPTWPKARHWSYAEQLGMEEGFQANEVEYFTLPALWGRPASGPNSWLRYAQELCSGRRFDQVWVEVIHSELDEAFLEWLAAQAPVRVGFLPESLEYDAREVADFPFLKMRPPLVAKRLRYLTHAMAFDEMDAARLNTSGPVPAMWWPAAVPEGFICRQIPAGGRASAVFCGALYGERQTWLNRSDLQGLLERLPPPEDGTPYPKLFDELHHWADVLLRSGRKADEQALTTYLDGLRRLRRELFSLWLQGLQSGSAVVNLPHLVKSYAGRVVEAMAAGRPVISWEIPGRLRNRALFEDGREIILFSRNDPASLADRLERLRGDADLGRKIAGNARDKILQYHTAEKRVEQILDWIEAGALPDYGEGPGSGGAREAEKWPARDPASGPGAPPESGMLSGRSFLFAPSFRIVALISAYNEGDVIYHVIGDLIGNGIEVYLIDNSSTDDTVAQAEKWLGKGLLRIERFPEESGYPERNGREYVWRDLLRRKAELALELAADWYIHADADEFRESPWLEMNLRKAMHWVDLLGYSAINFRVLNFRPTDDRFVPGSDVRDSLTFYEPAASFDWVQIKAWKNTGQPVDLQSTGGHEVRFPGRRIFPLSFILRHYPIRGKTHGQRKVFSERKPRFAAEERASGWHVQYDQFQPGETRFLRDPGELTAYDPGRFRAELLGQAVQDLLLLDELAGRPAGGGPFDSQRLTRWMARTARLPQPPPLEAVGKADEELNSLLRQHVLQKGEVSVAVSPAEASLWLAVARIKKAQANLSQNLPALSGLEELSRRIAGEEKASPAPARVFREQSRIPSSGPGKRQGKAGAKTSIIILTHDQLEYTRQCLRSVERHTFQPYELILVENGSTDGTLAFLKDYASARKYVRLLIQEENLGFAEGNNRGLAVATGDQFLLLNNDVVVTPDWLERLRSCSMGGEAMGVVGPKSNWVSGPQAVPEFRYDPHTLKNLDLFAREFTRRHFGRATRFWRVVGFCMLIKRGVVERIGGFDRRYGLGNFEDDDFSLRAALAGFESWIAEDCFIHHFGHRTFLGAGIDYRASLLKNWEIFKRRWDLPPDLPYGMTVDLSPVLKTGFIREKHFLPLAPQECPAGVAPRSSPWERAVEGA